MNINALRISLLCSLLTACLFGVFSLVFYFGDWTRFMFVFLMGLFVGLLAAPEIAAKSFKYGSLLQLSSGLLAGLVMGLFFELNITEVLLVGFLGAFLGWLTLYWVKYVQIS